MTLENLGVDVRVIETVTGDAMDSKRRGRGRLNEAGASAREVVLLLLAASACCFTVWLVLLPPPEPLEGTVCDPFPPSLEDELGNGCDGAEQCRREALAAWKRAKQHASSDAVAGPSREYVELVRTRAFLRRGDVDPVPPEITPLDDRIKELESALDVRFQGYRVKFLDQKKRRNHESMVEILEYVDALFPDPETRWHRWSVEQKEMMRYEGLWPAPFSAAAKP